MLRWPRDFDNEPDNPNHIMRSAGPEDRNSLGVHPLGARVGPHNPELTRCVRGTIRPEQLHCGFVKSTPILRIHALQEQTEFSGHIALNTENMPQLVRPILFACVKINVEESDFFCPPEFHCHLFFSLLVASARGGDLFPFRWNRRAVCYEDIGRPKLVTPEWKDFVSRIEVSFAPPFAQRSGSLNSAITSGLRDSLWP
jgi:hypothetical protein